MKLKTLALATSVAVAAMSAAGPAQATALATSVLDISSLRFLDSGGAILSVSDFNSISAGNTADISTSLDGTTLTDSASGAGEDIDLQHIVLGVPNPAYAENSYSVYTNPSASTFSLADQSQFGSPIAGFTDPNTGLPISAPATASHAAYVVLDTVSDGTSTANNGLQSGFDFVTGAGGDFTIAFDARAYLEAWNGDSEVFPTQASAAYNLTFSIDEVLTNNTVFSWSPDGNAGGGTGLNSETDPFSLNNNLSVNAPIGNGIPSWEGAALGSAFFGSWSATTTLSDNTLYRLTIRSSAEADAREVQAVPEPATLALMGLGMLGLGAFRRRRA